MRSLPIAFTSVIGVFAPVFSRPVWHHVTVRLTGAVLTPGKRTVTAMRQMMGRRAASDVQTSHRVLHRAVWSPLTASRLLLTCVVAVCIPSGVVAVGLDDTIERRRGDHSAAQGISRDPVRSSHAHLVTVRGLRGLACMLLVPLSWADRVWALPCLTALGPSERCEAQRGRRHQPLTARAGPMMRRVVRWVPGRERVLVADSRLAALELRDNVTTLPRGRVLTRRRLAAALSDPPPPRTPRTPGRPRLTGQRWPTLEAVVAAEQTPWTRVLVAQGAGERPRAVDVATDTAGWSHTGQPPVALRWVLRRDPHECCKPQALLSTHLAQTPAPMLPWVVRRWTMEVTGEAARAHLGRETQRPWHARAMARTTPARLRLDSIMTLNAPLLIDKGMPCVRRTAGSGQTRPTFLDAMALVRRQLWEHLHCARSPQETDMIKIPRALFERFIDAVCYAT